MTALAGVWNFNGATNAGSSARRMLAAQRVYGPQGDAVWDGGDVAMGRCLFATLPEDRHDRGAVAGSGGRYQLVGDVRLDDREELSRALGIAADAARNLPDAALLLHAWERWRESCFERLYGDYAFALWDAAARRLVLARDHIGSRPLHYHRGDGFLAFASMPKGLHALPAISTAPDAIKVAEMLALVPDTGPRSFFRDISRVEGGEYVVIATDRIARHRHWDPTPRSIGSWRGTDAVEGLRAHLDDAVRACLRGAGDTVGAHLSAGFDSSAVTATAARLLAPSGGRVTAFTAVPRQGYDGATPSGRISDEGPLAAATAAFHPNIDHVLVRSGSGSVTDGWNRAFDLLERPLLNPCNDGWWSAINAGAAERGISVMLTGEMGNMTISYAGYELLPELVRKGALHRLLREGRALVRNRRMTWTGVAGAAFGPWAPEALWVAIQRRRGRGNRRIEEYTAMRADRAAAIDLRALAKERGLDTSYRPRKDAFESRLWVMRRMDKGNFQKAALGGYGIDQRDPTADRRLIEFCLSLPTGLFLQQGETRALGMRALADRLPAQVLAERRKGYQAADWHEGLTAGREQLAAAIDGFADLPAAAAMLDIPRMQALIADLPQTGWETSAAIEQYRMTLLRGSAIGHFLRHASKADG